MNATKAVQELGGDAKVWLDTNYDYDVMIDNGGDRVRLSLEQVAKLREWLLVLPEILSKDFEGHA